MASEEFQAPRWYSTDINLRSHHYHDHILITIAIFFILIILIVSFLSFIFACHCDRSSVSRGTNSRSATGGTQSKGLDAATISGLPSFLHGSLPNCKMGVENCECSICLGLFQENELVKMMPECLHAFHSECVDKWLSTRSSCPLCRASIDSFSASVLIV